MSDRESPTSDDGTVPSMKPTDLDDDDDDDGFPSKELRRIYKMASPPYAFPKSYSVAENEKRRRDLLRVIQYKLPPPHNTGVSWRRLDQEIKALAASIRTFRRPWKMLLPETRDSLVQLAGDKNAELFYVSHHVAPYLMRAWLWRTLDDNIFSSSNLDKWATPTWELYGGLLSFFSSRTGTLDGCLGGNSDAPLANPAACREGEYHDWRRFTLRMMRQQLGWGQRHSSVERLADLMLRKLADLIGTATDGGIPLPQGHFEQPVKALADMAVVVDLCLLSEAGHFMIAWHLPGMPDAASMRGYTHRESPALQNCGGTWGREGEPIDFVVCPGIFRSGGKIGIRYEEGQWIAPIVAVINQFPDGVRDGSDQDEESVPPLGAKRYRRDASGRLVSFV
jgi:hypothetical protein